LKTLMDYYSYHLDGFRKPKSLDVLKEVFAWKKHEFHELAQISRCSISLL
jgi:hypothetical protein